MISGEWVRVVQSILTRGQILSWKADFLDSWQTLAAANLKPPRSPSAFWTFEKLSGEGKYAVEPCQQSLLLGLLAQTATAALGAWCAIPARGSVIMPLTKVFQGAQEDYSEFVSHLLEAAERTVGQEEPDNKIIKQLAYENSNSTCKAVLSGKDRDKDLNEMIRLCCDIDTFTHKVSQAVHLAVGVALQQTGSQKGCFKCGQSGILPSSALCCHLLPLLFSSPRVLVPGPHSLAPSAPPAGGSSIGPILVGPKRTSLEILCLPFRETA